MGNGFLCATLGICASQVAPADAKKGLWRDYSGRQHSGNYTQDTYTITHLLTQKQVEKARLRTCGIDLSDAKKIVLEEPYKDQGLILKQYNLVVTHLSKKDTSGNLSRRHDLCFVDGSGFRSVSADPVVLQGDVGEDYDVRPLFKTTAGGALPLEVVTGPW